jgi:hypothetical protein
MQLMPIPKRTLHNVGPAIWRAIEVIEQQFGGHLTHDSGHDRTEGQKSATWIFTFPRHRQAQLAVRMNKEKLTVYLRATAPDGRPMEPLLQGLATVEDRYPNPKNGPAASLTGTHAPYLNPSAGNGLLRVDVVASDVAPLLARYLGVSGATDASVQTSTPREAHQADSAANRSTLSAEELQTRQERQSEVGQAGEMLVVLDEMARLRDLGCPSPDKFVARVALTDVGRGYDIESTWPGAERCIEVKSTTRAGADFFITDNECRVLAQLCTRAWLYRVVVDDSGEGAVAVRLNDPMRHLDSAQFIPVVFRVKGGALDKLAPRRDAAIADS